MLTEFDDMIANIISNRKPNPKVTQLFSGEES